MLKDYSWQVSEEEYRNNKILSYSLIAKYEREGFKIIPTLFDKVETNSLSLGSAFDILYTESNEFSTKVTHLNTDIDLSTKAAQIVIDLANKCTCETLPEVISLYKDVMDGELLSSYYPNIKSNEKKWNMIVSNEGLCSLYTQQFYNQNKKSILLNNSQWSTLMEMSKCVSNHPKISKILDNEEKENLEKYYQLKFKTSINGREYRCMFDRIIVNNEKKIIALFDIKTTYEKAYNFQYSFIKWRYDIQDRLYYLILKEVLKDTEYKDYEIKDMTNIVVSTTDLNPKSNPLLFTFPYCNKRGNIELSYTILRDPITIGEELYTILDNSMEIPPYINKDEENDIINLLNRKQNEHNKEDI